MIGELSRSLTPVRNARDYNNNNIITANTGRVPYYSDAVLFPIIPIPTVCDSVPHDRWIHAQTYYVT